ncbi:MAG TPA: leucyl aminopeptidase [Gemmatales bacterium]|nr:leucyl aminopeptidase [Gemmatales bacterium]HMP58923.1 leucyl aminopeptidase [Gemmatales bacterium]
MHVALRHTPLQGLRTDWLVVPSWEEGWPAAAADLDRLLEGRLQRLVERGDFTGKLCELVPLFLDQEAPAPRLLLVGLGPRSDATRGTLRRAGIAAAKRIAGKAARQVDVLLPDAEGELDWPALVLGLVGGFLHGCHSPALLKSEPGRFAPELVQVGLASAEPPPGFDALLAKATAVGSSVNLARELVNLPPNELFPESFAQRCRGLGREFGFECEIMDERRLSAERMNTLLAVAQGSARTPRVVMLSAGQGPRTLALVGKGVTFDSGGLSLKTNEQMLDMKCDMAGAAAVVAALTAISGLSLPVRVIGLIALVENMPSGTAMRVGDVVRTRNGKTVEVCNTDAEGRLILADVLDYTVEHKANHLVDLATLTGACLVALGSEIAGLFSNDDGWAGSVQAAANRAGERVWRLPLPADYGEQLKSHVADLKNVGGKHGGAITAALFLREFVRETPWVHLDIAGPAFASDESPARDAGGTGFGVATLVELVEAYAAEKAG